MISIDEIVDLSLRLLERIKRAEDRVKQLEAEVEELKGQLHIEEFKCQQQLQQPHHN